MPERPALFSAASVKLALVPHCTHLYTGKLGAVRLRGIQLLTDVASCEGEAEGRAMTRALIPSIFYTLDSEKRARIRCTTIHIRSPAVPGICLGL